ncbi:probable LRR receptor-like serine/threonine-protein kinase At1g06840 [Selaginella moellendorffii]|uniref:probable LRR receptor-like serine/threonine-protein kinase At1g06840 n=1 Tax=Selaginella moellendorffii TaxID=88036 RepID=UPI000D1CB34C|nr:probable LRR receptor-like serine/threonine-protein kinase At1g06840 [Selaginella moellendorffii]|eukprot:XP_024517128.1 probable LRR receptor-like serine/threonine-protein kinase At1g06840 [Selaginella moellendorffii]
MRATAGGAAALCFLRLGSAAAAHDSASRKMDRSARFRIGAVALLLWMALGFVQSVTDSSEVAALRAFQDRIVDNNARLENWWGNDPCGNGTNWEGVFCERDSRNIFHVVELRLLNHQLSGTLAPELGNLRWLRILDVMWNDFTGSIPPTFGMLENLDLLLLNGNKLTGELPWELGNLTRMNRIQIDQNNITGPIPPTFGNLTSAKHFHMNNNSLTGSIPPDIGRLPNIVHILLDNNKLEGRLPVELSNLRNTLLILQLDNNRFADDAVIPAEYGTLQNLFKISLRNCNIQGQVPDLSRISQLGYLDLSNNNLTGEIPNTGISSNITSIDLSNNSLSGNIPSSFNNLPNLQALILHDNRLNGSVDGALIAGLRNSSQRLLLDFQSNSFSNVDPSLVANISASSGMYSAWLGGNPLCQNSPRSLSPVCQSGTLVSQTAQDNGFGNNRSESCTGLCDPNSELIPALAVRGQCVCASPAVVAYRLKSPGFTFFDRYINRFEGYISSGLNLTRDQVFLKGFRWEKGPRLAMNISFYPPVQNRTNNVSELRRLYHAFGGWLIPDDDVFGPYEFLGFTPPFGIDLYDIIPRPEKKKLTAGAIAGILIAVVAVTAAVVGTVVFFLARRRSKRMGKSSRKRIITDKRELNEMLKVAGVKSFSYGEMLAATASFDDARLAGQGGYGKVYRGVLSDGHVVAVKRAEEGSLQGTHEFYTEIELLSRVHHRNLLSLVGYCDDEGEQMLVYEFMEGGTLRERLSPTIKLPLDFATRLRIALGSARGILYLHTEANPPIFHRDIKASNILLDGKNIPKVADFGLSRLAPSPDLDGVTPGHVSTVVKGTPGYLDPEYFLTRKLTDKSDVYSFGVVLMELVTGMHPISQGKNLVREVTATYQAGMVLSIVDQRMGSYPSEGLEPMLRLALSCVKENPNDRPSMGAVVRDLDDLWRSMPWSDAFSTFDDHHQSKSRSDESARPRDLYNELYVSSSAVEESGLFSGTIHAVAPR